MQSIEQLDSLSRESQPPEPSYLKRGWGNENVLHVYPRTFNAESTEQKPYTGMGSIKGITEKLPWIKDSGTTAIWLGPIYASPGLDGNYDISDYRQVNPEIGTMEDTEILIEQAHKHDIRVIFDLVPNHTSDQSEWFKASSDPNSLKHQQYKNYYIWRDAIEGELPKNIVDGGRLTGTPAGFTVPNNWSSIFSTPQIDKVREQYGGNLPQGVDIPAVTAWVWSETRQQFYLAEFLKEQPSLDHSNTVVREEIKDIVRFWLDKGVDSFRVDVINHTGKDITFENEVTAIVGDEIGQYRPGVTNPHDQWKQEKLVSHWPELGKYSKDLLSVLDEKAYQHKNIRMVFEDWMSALGDDKKLDSLRPEKASVFNFEMLLNTNRKHWAAQNIGKIIHGYYERMEQLEGSVPNQVTGNHDTDTLRTRLGALSTMRSAYLVLAALPGALYTWQGDMLGRPNAVVPEELQKDGKIGKRDGERIPMQWNSSFNSGFSNADSDKLWLPTVDQKYYHTDNIEIQSKDPNSPYRFIREVLRLRQNDYALKGGALRLLHTDHQDALAFARKDVLNPRRQVISLTNFSRDSIEVSVLDTQHASSSVLVSSRSGMSYHGERIDLSKPIILTPDNSYLLSSE